MFSSLFDDGDNIVYYFFFNYKEYIQMCKIFEFDRVALVIVHACLAFNKFYICNVKFKMHQINV